MTYKISSVFKNFTLGKFLFLLIVVFLPETTKPSRFTLCNSDIKSYGTYSLNSFSVSILVFSPLSSNSALKIIVFFFRSEAPLSLRKSLNQSLFYLLFHSLTNLPTNILFFLSYIYCNSVFF